MGSKKELGNANWYTNQTLNSIHSRLRVLALTRFEWVGLPDSCDVRFLEKTLCDDGRAIFIKHPEYGFLNLRCTVSGNLNIYENPVKYNAFSIGLSTIVDPSVNCVRIRNNLLDIPTDFTLQLYARRICDAERTTDVNILAQKTPILIVGSDSQRKTLEYLYAVWKGDSPVVFGNADMIPESLKTLKTDAPYVADKLQEYKRDIYNEVLTFLGIATNPTPDKKERQVVNEVDSNNELTELNIYSMLSCRQDACKQINKMFGLNVSCRLRQTFEDEEPKGGEDD